MPTLTRKQQEIAQREREILAVARKLFRQDGYLGFNMDRIAQELRVAKGTVYHHFSCKEEVILAMTLETMERRLAMFEKAAVFSGRSRERLAAVGCAAELFVEWYPDHFELEKVLSCESIIEKTSEKMRGLRNRIESQCMQLIGGLVRDAAAHGDLDLGDVPPDQVVFGLWSNTFGGYSIASSSETFQRVDQVVCFQMVRENNNRMLDGYGWRPLSTEVDYDAIFLRVREELFGDGRGHHPSSAERDSAASIGSS